MVRKVTKKDKDGIENQVLLKINNKWEFMAYVFKYRLKELLAVLLLFAIIVLVFQNSGIDFNMVINSIFGVRK